MSTAMTTRARERTSTVTYKPLILFFTLLVSLSTKKFTASSFTLFRHLASPRTSTLVEHKKSRTRWPSLPYPTTTAANWVHQSATPLRYVKEDDIDVDSLRSEIDALREEAKNRINALSNKMDKTSFQSDNDISSSSVAPPVPIRKTPEQRRREMEESIAASAPIRDQKEDEDMFIEEAIIRRREKDNAPANTVPGFMAAKDMDLLDNTHWRVALNIGREPGTWMPKTWGVSGERLLLNLEVEFSPRQLFEREIFLDGLGGAKVLHVVNNELTLGPSMTEGSRKVRVKDGGWKIAPGEGPMGTDILRFYVELESEVRHQGGDVYCPAGRIYCTCGYFPQKGTGSLSSTRMTLRKKQNELERKEQELWEALDADESLFGLNKIKLRTELFQLGLDASKLNEQLKENMVRDPEKSMLRMSRKRDVALTREGGVCCKVTKGVAYEYHILGKFGLAAVEPKGEEKQ